MKVVVENICTWMFRFQVTLSEQTKKLEGVYGQKLADLEELKKSVLKKAFSGEL